MIDRASRFKKLPTTSYHLNLKRVLQISLEALPNEAVEFVNEIGLDEIAQYEQTLITTL